MMTGPTVPASDVYRLAGDLIMLAAVLVLAAGPIIAHRLEQAEHHRRLYGQGLG